MSKAEEFLSFVKKECEEAGVKYLFPETKKVPYLQDENMLVSGYFDDVPEPILACAIGKPEEEWYQILVHESCHMDQWKEKSEAWKSIDIQNMRADQIMDKWLGGMEFEDSLIKDSIRIMQAVELDCEIRSVEKIKKLDLPIDIPQYIKKANSYLYLYSAILHTRKWPDVAPYEVPEIVQEMPENFLDKVEDYYNIPDNLLQLFQKL